jgi:ubiquinone/menaquinone biosynthesis C-methylase UbiE
MTTQAERDPDGRLFDDRYALAHGGQPGAVPWAHREPHPSLVAWLRDSTPPTPGRDRALVVGSGLGDDAEALARHGWDVTAFDISETAIAWARERFPASTVRYRVASIFDTPGNWRGTFDLVVEIFTIQSLPPTRRQAIIEQIASTVAESGTLFVVAFMRDAVQPAHGRPWPLTDRELASFARYGLLETGRRVEPRPAPDRPQRVRVTFTRPDAGIHT